MKKFLLYDATGRIVSSGECGDADFALQARPGLTLIEAPGNALEDYWDGNKAIAKGLAPSRFHAFDFAVKKWLDPRGLDDLRAATLQSVKQSRADAGRTSMLNTRFGTFQSDDASVDAMTAKAAMLQSAALAGKAPATVIWTLADNTSVPLSAAELGEVIALALDRDEMGRGKLRRLREQIKTATAEQLEKITWADKDANSLRQRR